MIFGKHLLNGGLVLMATITMTLSKFLPHRINDNLERFKRFTNKTAINSNLSAVVPFHYNVVILFYFEDNYLFGDCSINISIHQQLESISLITVPIRIIHAILINNNNTKQYKIKMFTAPLLASHFFTDKYNVPTIHFSEVISPGVYTLNIMYTRMIHNDKNLFLSAYQKNLGDQMFRQMGVEIMRGPQLFPYINNLTNNSTFKIVIRHNNFYNVLSNIPKRTQRRAENARWTDFDGSLSMSPQDIVVVITTIMRNVSSQLANVTIWCRESACKHLLYAKDVIEQIFPYFKQEFLKGLSNLDIVALWNSQEDNINTLGLILWREEDITYNEMLHPVIRKWEVALTIARQLAFLWCDNATLWSKEGFATLFGIYILDQVFPDKQMTNLMVVQAQSDSFRYDTPTWHISPDNTIPSNLSLVESSRNNIKSFIIWRMLYYLIPDQFWHGIRKYVDMHRMYSNMTEPDHLWTIWQTILKEEDSNNELKTNLKSIITNWTTVNFYPIINVTRNYKNMTVSTKHMISSYLRNKIRTQIWTHLTFTTESSLNFNEFDSFLLYTEHRSKYYIIKNKFVDKEFDKNEFETNGLFKSKSSNWIIVNIQQIGYYRVNYDIENWQKLMRYLNSENYDKIHILNRAQIIDDAFFFFLQKKIDYNMLWNLTSFVSQDRNFVTWYPMFKVFESMSCIYPLEYGREITNKIKDRLEQLLTKIGYSNEPADHNLTIYLREEAVKWACILDVLECRLNAASKLNTELVKKETSSLTGKKWIYCYSLTTADNYTWYKIWQKWNLTSDERFLEYLSCSEDSTIICSFLNMTILENIELNEGKRINWRANAFLFTIAKHAKEDKVVSCLFQIIKDVRLTSNGENDIIATLIVIITHMHKEDQMREVGKLTERYVKPMVMRAVEKKIRIRRFEYGRLIRNYGRYFT